MEELFAQMCVYMQLNFNFNGDACKSSLKASYAQSGTKKEVDEVQKIEEKDFYNTIDRRFIVGGAIIGGAFDAYKKQEIKLSAPLKPFCDNLSFDLTNSSQQYNVIWKWNW